MPEQQRQSTASFYPDIDGSMVGELYHKADATERKINMQRIVTYCQKDVVTTANIILRFKNIALLQEGDVEVVM